MKVSHNTSLKLYNTFGIEVKANTFISVEHFEDLKLALSQNYSTELFILGGGSNMLLTKDVENTVLHIALKGKEIISETDQEVFLKVNAGENWHELVLFALENNWGGLENLSLIPGNVGTAPIQNIGAYGVELKDTVAYVEAIDVQTLILKTFSNKDCEFGYRDSIFKSKVKGKYIITSVTFRLQKKDHKLITNYGAIQQELERLEISSPGIRDVSNAVIKIRKEKLPDPAVLGNSGSFFKNPVVPVQKHKDLLLTYPDMPGYKVTDEEFKIPAGWLIERAGLKGYRSGDAGVHKNQALVLVNYGAASGREILFLAQKIQAEIFEKFGVTLETEVNIF